MSNASPTPALPAALSYPVPTVGSLVDDVPPGSPSAPALRAALATPYTLDEWREDLRALAAGVPTGFDALDDVALSWLPGKLYAVAARPGGGKTGFMLEAVARCLEAQQGATGVFLSWEEPLAELVLRLVLRADARIVARVNGNASSFSAAPIFRSTARAWGRGESVPPEIAGRLTAAAEAVRPLLARLRLVDGDAMGRNVHAVLAGVATWMRETGTRPALVAIDYFQKLRAAGFYPTRQAELQAVSDVLRRFAKGATLAGDDAPGERDAVDPAHAVPVLVGAQVTRGKGVHPTADDVRESDDLLNDAAGLLLLSKESTGGTADDEACALRLSVGKNRDGRTRGEHVARLPWHPARVWIASGALRDGAQGPIRWTPLATLETPAGGGTAALTPERVLGRTPRKR